MDQNPLSDREKALENQWIREKEKQMAKDRATKARAAKDASSTSQGQQASQEAK
ncbi:hypothetical protein B0T16DRAFT_456103 [Cercophora newfieldiana]|uniref:Uncharacterized protein n=1 Tax=Cercophora newfieldiana TaxID=92897 RepID=A0AA39YBV9_9PEZI|nr:hypothetical protein B0T16DRAFT_456103 [Cercophora newfieldiana]